MIPSLRKARHQSVSEKKFSKYLTYAIGEIILIVAGVLIALQVDNWHEKQMQHQKEITYIEEIRKSLVSDLSELEKVFSFNEEKDSCINETFKIMGNRQEEDDYLMQIAGFIYTMARFELFHPNYVAYNTMVSAESVNLIRNDSLRIALANYYGNEAEFETGTQERVKNKTRQFVDRVIPKILTNDIARLYSGLDLDYDFPNVLIDEVRSDPAIFHEIMVMKINTQSQNQELDAVREEIESILKMISAL